MRKPWPQVQLGNVLAHRKQFIQIDDLAEYKRCRVQLHARGIVLRDTIEGAAIKTKSQQVCRSGEFLVAEIDAKVGGFGIVPEDLDGAIVSSHYFLFTVNENKLDKRFLGYFIRTPQFRDQVGARGTTNYAAIRPSHVLSYEIPRPPLSEQRRIVAKIEQLAAKIDEARGLREDVRNACHALCRALLFDETVGTKFAPMGEILRLREPDVTVVSTERYRFAGVYCFGRGVFVGEERTGLEFSYPRLTRLRTGDFVYPKLMAWEGALGIVPQECNGLVVSTEYPVFELDHSRVLPEVLDVYFRSPSVWPELSGASIGTNVRRRRLNPRDFLNYKMPLPPMSVQEQLRHLKSKTDQILSEQAQSAAELDALLPSILDKAFKGEL